MNFVFARKKSITNCMLFAFFSLFVVVQTIGWKCRVTDKKKLLDFSLEFFFLFILSADSNQTEIVIIIFVSVPPEQ